jgi:hypothetical protein
VRASPPPEAEPRSVCVRLSQFLHFATRAAAELRESAKLELAGPLTVLGITVVERLQEHKLGAQTTALQHGQPAPRLLTVSSMIGE